MTNATNFSMNATFLQTAQSIISRSERIGVAVVFLVTSVLAIGGNLMVIGAVIRSKHLQTMGNAFVVCLSVANLVTGLMLPWSVVGLLSFEGWPLATEAPCFVAGLFLLTSIGASLYSLAGIAVNRVLSIAAPPRIYQWWFTPFKVAIMITLTWLVPFLTVLIPPLCDVGGLGYDENLHTCTDVAQHDRLRDYRLAIVLVCYPVPVTGVVTSYLVILTAVRRNFGHQKKQCKAGANQPSDFDWGAGRASRKSRLNRQQLSITANLFVNVCTFLLLNLPFGIALLLRGDDNNRRVIFTAMLFMTHAFVHPVLYGLKHPQFKLAFRQMLRLTAEGQPSSGSVCTRSEWRQQPPRSDRIAAGQGSSLGRVEKC